MIEIVVADELGPSRTEKMTRRSVFGGVLAIWCCVARMAAAEVSERVLAAAGDNRQEIEAALAKVPDAERPGLEFLLNNMPAHDLKSLSADFLLENTCLAYESRANDPWAKEIPEAIFFDAVLPYASINERRDNWRADFRKRFRPLVEKAKTPTEAAAILNQKVFEIVKVKYSTQRKKADQSPYESMETGLASCTGLSIILVDACRAVGVPARFVGTVWADKSGNHSWVEVWDKDWQFTGAAEPTGDHLNQAWFTPQAARALRDDELHRIYAASFAKTPLPYLCVWAPHVDYVSAVNVTDRYTRLARKKAEGQIDARFVVCSAKGQRVAADILILRDGNAVFAGRTNDDGFDTNDHLRVPLAKGAKHTIQLQDGDAEIVKEVTPERDDDLFEFTLAEEKPAEPAPSAIDETSATIQKLKTYLAEPTDKRTPIVEHDFAKTKLTADEAKRARELLSFDRLARLRVERKAEMEARELKHGDLKMPFFYKQFGKKPADGWSLYISLHGGGGAPAHVNDQQWENQKRLYRLEEGIYAVPRAPTNTWDLWHQGHIDPLFTRLIEDLVAFEGVNPNRVYVMGYSAGGDGVYQLAPRMADRWAAAAMMAGHPNETSPLGLRNVPFALQVGGLDEAYSRNKIAKEWGEKLDALQKDDADGYEHMVKVYPDKGHWMDLEDAIAVGWMAKHTRNPTPQRLVWKQDDVTHASHHWLAVDDENRVGRSETFAKVDGQTIELKAEQLKKLTVYLDDRFIDLEKPVKIMCGDKELHEGAVNRTIATLASSLDQSGDAELSFPASVTVDIPPPFPTSLVPPERIPQYTAVRTAKPLTIDGKLDEEAWTSATKTASFVDLISGEATRHETRAAILWDDEFLYVGFWVTEPQVTAEYLNRDDPIYYDNDVELFIAGKDAYYEFEINPHGTIYEAFFIWDDAYDAGGYAEDAQLKRGVAKSQVFNGVGLKNHPRGPRTAFLGYDFPGLKSAVAIDGTLNDSSDTDRGWTVELALPWKSMNWLAKGDGRSLPPKPNDAWRIDLFRFNKTKAPEPAKDSGGWALGKHGVWDSHVPEIFPVVTFAEK